MATHRKKIQRQTKETMDRWSTSRPGETGSTDWKKNNTVRRLLEVNDNGSQNSYKDFSRLHHNDFDEFRSSRVIKWLAHTRRVE